MQWYEYKRFSLALDLSAVHTFLLDQQVAHKFIERDGQQVLYLASLHEIESIDVFFARFLRGDATLPESQHVSAGGLFAGRHTWLLQPMFALFSRMFRTLPVTTLILALGFLGYIFTVVLPSPVLFSFSHFVGFPELLKNGHLWRLFTPIFLHFDINHIVFNALWVYLFGRVIEPFLGRLRYIAFIAVIALLSNSCQYLLGGHFYFGGLSGVAYGFVAYAGVGYLRYGQSRLAFLPALFVLSVASMALGFAGGLDWIAEAKIANWAHLSGFCTGGLIAFVQFFNRSRIGK